MKTNELRDWAANNPEQWGQIKQQVTNSSGYANITADKGTGQAVITVYQTKPDSGHQAPKNVDVGGQEIPVRVVADARTVFSRPRAAL